MRNGAFGAVSFFSSPVQSLGAPWYPGGMEAKTYIEDLRNAYRNVDDAAVVRLTARLRCEPWPTVALVCYRLMAIARPDDEESRWHATRLTPTLLESFQTHRGDRAP